MTCITEFGLLQPSFSTIQYIICSKQSQETGRRILFVGTIFEFDFFFFFFLLQTKYNYKSIQAGLPEVEAELEVTMSLMQADNSASYSRIFVDEIWQPSLEKELLKTNTLSLCHLFLALWTSPSTLHGFGLARPEAALFILLTCLFILCSLALK